MEASSKKQIIIKGDVFEDPKSNVLDLSKEPTEIVLRPSMLEELGEHGNELAIGNPRGKVELWAREGRLMRS